MNLTNDYYKFFGEITTAVYKKNQSTIQKLGVIIGQSIANGGILHTFGSGHSGIIAQEIIHRAGGLVPVSAIVDPTGGWVETIPGYGTKLIQRHHYTYQLKENEIIIIISNSGKNSVPLEVALQCKKLGLILVAVTSVEMSQSVQPNPLINKKLYEISNFVLDNCGIIGDAAIEIPGQPDKIGPTSTITGALLLNLVAMETIQYLVQNKIPPPIYRSANLPGARDFNEKISSKYKNRLSRPL